MLIKTDPPKTTVSDTELFCIKEEKHIQIQRYLQRRKIVAEKKSVRNCGHSCKETEGKKRRRRVDRLIDDDERRKKSQIDSRSPEGTSRRRRRREEIPAGSIRSCVHRRHLGFFFFRCFCVCERSLLSRCLCLDVLSRSAKVGDYVWLCVCVSV